MRRSTITHIVCLLGPVAYFTMSPYEIIYHCLIWFRHQSTIITFITFHIKTMAFLIASASTHCSHTGGGDGVKWWKWAWHDVICLPYVFVGMRSMATSEGMLMRRRQPYKWPTFRRWCRMFHDGQPSVGRLQLIIISRRLCRLWRYWNKVIIDSDHHLSRHHAGR